MSLRRKLALAASRFGAAAAPGLFTGPDFTKLLAAQGEGLARQVRGIEKIETLADVEFSVFSQWGEDGIIEWLVHHNGVMPEIFIEFGVETYREASTRFLMMNRNWRGLIIDGSPSNIAMARRDAISWRHDLASVASFITKDNINMLIGSAGLEGEIGILSVDIDGNDYWVWDAINCVSPHFVIAEYNSAFGDLLPLTVPYHPSFVRARAHSSYLYYGASIAALSELAEKKGYVLLGTNRAGSNVFYARRDRALGLQARIADPRPRPSRFREARDAAGNLTFARGTARTDFVGDCFVMDVLTGKVGPLGSFGSLYSERWLKMLDGKL